MSDENKPKYSATRWHLFFLVLVLGLCGIFYRFLNNNGLENSAALYLGLPLLIALGLCLTPKAKSTTGILMQGLTIALLTAIPVLQEGVLCLLFGSPIMYAVVAFIGIAEDRRRKRQSDGDGGTNLEVAVISVLIAGASLEGTHEALTFNRHNEVQHSRIVNANIADVRAKLAATPDFKTARSLFIRIFPLPQSVEGSGLKVGDERKLHFVYNKWIYFNPHKGNTVFRVTEAKENYISFSIPHDNSYLSNYLKWESSEVFLEALGKNQTRVTWKLAYQRKLDPIWYFGPMQHYAAKLTAETLIDNVADPRT